MACGGIEIGGSFRAIHEERIFYLVRYEGIWFQWNEEKCHCTTIAPFFKHLFEAKQSLLFDDSFPAIPRHMRTKFVSDSFCLKRVLWK